MDGTVSTDPRAKSLPPTAFTTAEFAGREQISIWPFTWSPLISPELPPDSGERVPATWRGSPVFSQRVNDDITVYPNVCTHAWHTLVHARSRGATFSCPQHGRVFRDDGSCAGQLGMEAPDFPGAADGLTRLRCASLGPLLFAAEPSAPADFAILEQVRASLGTLDLAKLRPAPELGGERELAGNWKLHAANYLDSSHIRFIHGRSLSQTVDLASYTTEIHDGGVLQWARAKDPQLGFTDVLDARFGKDVFALWWFLWPNMTLNFYPWGLSLNLYEPGSSPTSTKFSWQCWHWNDADPELWSLQAADDEDLAAISRVSAGVQSPFARRGRFGPDETAVQWFHESISAATRSL